jgi:Ni,Fe-hydrogenase I cytochrome b subunit
VKFWPINHFGFNHFGRLSFWVFIIAIFVEDYLGKFIGSLLICPEHNAKENAKQVLAYRPRTRWS